MALIRAETSRWANNADASLGFALCGAIDGLRLQELVEKSKMTLGMIICAVALILALWILAFELNRIGDALWHMQADLHDIRCSINAIGEPAYKLLTAQVKEQPMPRPNWLPEVHTGPNCFPE
jgi:hypothetical protein